MQFFASIGNASAPPKTTIDWLAIGDPQYSAGSARGAPRQYMIRDSIRHARRTFKSIDFAVIPGDYAEQRVNQNGQDYTELNGILREYPGEWFTCIGNHDVNVPSKDHPDEIPAFFDQADVFETNPMIETVGYGRITRGDVDIIILNSCENINGGPSPVTGAFAFLQTQLDWLSSELTLINSRSAKVIVLLHAPMKTDALRENSPPADNLHDQGQVDEIINLLIDWQAASDGGLVLAVISGHTHIGGSYETTTGNGTINHFTLDELDNVPGGYAGSATTSSSDTRHMSYAHFSFDDSTKVLTVTGVGEQDSYVVDMSNRV